MKNIYFLSFILLSLNIHAQVGVNTESPKATLEIKSKPSINTYIDGAILPKLTRQELTDKGDNLYGADQTGAVIYITNVSGGDQLSQRINIDNEGYYYFDGTEWKKIRIPAVLPEDENNIYNVNGRLISNRTVNLDGKTLNFSNTSGTPTTNQFSIDGTTFSVDALNKRIGLGTITPNYNLEAKGTVAMTDVKDIPVPGPFKPLGINAATGQLGTLSMTSAPILHLVSNYNSYTAAAYGALAYFELTDDATLITNSINATITNDGTAGSTNTDYITLTEPGIYKIDVNFSFITGAGLGAVSFEVMGTPDANPGNYSNLYRSYAITPHASARLLGTTTFAVFDINVPTRIRLGARHTESGITILKPTGANGPSSTFNIIINKL